MCFDRDALFGLDLDIIFFCNYLMYVPVISNFVSPHSHVFVLKAFCGLRQCFWRPGPRGRLRVLMH